MKRIAYIQDNVFMYAGAKSVSLWGDNLGLEPEYIKWVSDIPRDKTVWFSDACIYQAEHFKCARKIAWLCEPPPFRQGHYDYVKWHEHLFDYVLTFDERLLKSGNPKYLYYPMGGSFIHKSRWVKTPKVKLVSLIVSNKTEATGHKLRHLIAEQFKGRIDIMGSGVGDYTPKYESLRDYAFTICVESEKLNTFFNDKLVDAFATRTIPIYWGCDDLSSYFDTNGILQFNNHNELDAILNRLSMELYYQMNDAVEYNYTQADLYYCAEDWIYEHHPFLFE
jgi:hypothetical protein